MPDTDRIPSMRQIDHLYAQNKIEMQEDAAREAASLGVNWEPTPEQRLRDELCDAPEIRRVNMPEASSVPFASWRNIIAFGAMIGGAPIYSLIATAFVMALAGMVLPTTLAPAGMAALFVLSIPISTIYWIRYHRDEQLHDAMDDLQDRIIELEQALTERLDLIERNV